MKNKNLISAMTLKQKASLMSGMNFWSTKPIPEMNIPSIFLADGPHGLRRQAVGGDHLGLNESLPATCFPTAATLANSWDVELLKEVGTYLGKEAVAQKVSVLLGPGTNIKRNPLGGRNFEYFSEDPLLAGKMVSGIIQGIQSEGVAATVKHFVANNQELRRMGIDAVIDERALRELYLRPFEMAVKEGKTQALMTAYNKINGAYANQNQPILRDILRKEWKFDGVVVSDWGGNDDRVLALKAGSDLEMPSTNGETDKAIVKAVNDGTLEESVLDEAVDRLITLVNNTKYEDSYDDPSPIEDDTHHTMAQKAAEESIVLLKNNGVLPLKKSAKLGIIGDFAKTPRFQGAGSSIVNPTRLDNTLDIINEFPYEFTGYSKGFHRYGKKGRHLRKDALKLAEKSDVVLLYLGLDEYSEVEGIDRKTMKLPNNQLQLIEALKETEACIIVMLSLGSLVEMPFEADVSAIVHMYLAGQAGALSALNVVSGNVNPSGKLAESYPVYYEDVPTKDYFPGNEKTVEYRESIFVGYRYYDTKDIDLLYPFGHGLSYTTFSYDNLQVDESGARFTITNTGKLKGAEIPQLYVGVESSSKVFRAAHELKGFTKISLEPNETKTVNIEFDERTFSYYDVESKEWEVEENTYLIQVGSSSRDIRLNGSLRILGTKKTSPYKPNDLPTYHNGDITKVKDSEFEILLNRAIPKSSLDFYKRKRIVVNRNTTVAQLRYSKRWIGRFIPIAVRLSIGFLRILRKRDQANLLIMGVYHQPLRGLSRMSGGKISWTQLKALMHMFNGHFFKGMHRYLKASRMKKRLKRHRS
jgi:beta-glucosidase